MAIVYPSAKRVLPLQKSRSGAKPERFAVIREIARLFGTETAQGPSAGSACKGLQFHQIRSAALEIDSFVVCLGGASACKGRKFAMPLIEVYAAAGTLLRQLKIQKEELWRLQKLE